MKNIIILNSHPIQYFTPLFQKMSKDREINLNVLFCSNIGAVEYFDEGFGKTIKWDIPILEGFNYTLLKNYASDKNVLKGFWGAINLGIIPYLFNAPKSTLIVFGWNYVTNILAIVFGKLFGHKVCLRCDIPITRENYYYKSYKKILRKIIFTYILFTFIDYFLYIGEQNKEFYRKYGANEEKLIFSPFAVDNDRFSRFYNENIGKKQDIKNELQFPENKRVLLFSGKYISIKQPLQLLKAFHSINAQNAILVFVGDGELRKDMEDYIVSNKITNVLLTGFVNQTDICKYYLASDIFIMCSKLDAWGLSVNEAMNFHLPLLLSNQTCCATDLLIDGENGFTYTFDDENALSNTLSYYLKLSDNEIQKMGDISANIIDHYNYNKIISSLKEI